MKKQIDAGIRRLIEVGNNEIITGALTLITRWVNPSVYRDREFGDVRKEIVGRLLVEKDGALQKALITLFRELGVPAAA
jgi:hypothetical protein